MTRIAEQITNGAPAVEVFDLVADECNEPKYKPSHRQRGADEQRADRRWCPIRRRAQRLGRLAGRTTPSGEARRRPR